MQKSYINRPKYFDKIKPFIGKELIKVLTGQRRVGKSYLMFQIIEYIKQYYDNANIIYINKELSDFDTIENYRDLQGYIKSKTISDSQNFIFIDEIQLINEFERALKSFFAQGYYDIYITGSNANLLSGELATLLSGRYIEIQIYPLDYNEFLHFHKLKDSNENFNKFIKFGGLPYLHNIPLTDEVVFDYLQSVYQAIMYKDVIARYNVRNVNFLERLIRFLAGNIASPVSARSIAKFLKTQNIKIATTTVIDYLDFLNNSFVVNKVRRFDIIGKQIFSLGEKFYFTDIGLRNAIIGFSPFDLNRIIENIVYNHLVSNGYKVMIGKLKDFEIDFIAEKLGEYKYFQVALRIDSDETAKREFGNLLKIKDNYPKFVVTLDEYQGRSYQGIIHLPLRKLLTSF
jgi:hypothetical protein